MLTTDYLPGAPCWIDLGSPDTDASTTFYAAVLDWDFQSAGPDAGGYGFFLHDRKIVAAVGPLTQENTGSAWTIYFATPDADETVARAEKAGGTIRVAPYDVFDQGRTAALTDPAGADFAIWQGRARKGLDAVTEPGSLGWTELYVASPPAVAPFYAAALDHQSIEATVAGVGYTTIRLPGGDRPTIGGVITLNPGTKPFWLPYFEVRDVDAAVEATVTEGGTILDPPVSVDTVGRFAVLADQFGARFAVITSS